MKKLHYSKILKIKIKVLKIFLKKYTFGNCVLLLEQVFNNVKLDFVDNNNIILL